MVIVYSIFCFVNIYMYFSGTEKKSQVNIKSTEILNFIKIILHHRVLIFLTYRHVHVQWFFKRLGVGVWVGGKGRM